MTKIRCYDTATQIFRMVDVAEIPMLEIETDALAALRRVWAGDTDFIFIADGAEVPLDVGELMIRASWRQAAPMAA
jgi:hypothetical protein